MAEGGHEITSMTMDGPALFFRDDAKKLLQNKTIIFVGDSNMRSLYKDLVVLIEQERLCLVKEFQRVVIHPEGNPQFEPCFHGDSLTRGLTAKAKRDLEEVRHYTKHGVDMTYAFVTKCWPNYYLEDLFEKIEKGETKKPDMVIMCSMLWDICRYGPEGVNDFKKSLNELCVVVKRFLDPGTFIWMTNPPVGSQVTAVFLPKELGFLAQMMRFHVKEANDYSMDVMEKHEVDGFDIHYYMADLIDLRDPDATHWTPPGVRLMTCLVLTHLCLLWGIEPPKFDKKQYELVKDINYEGLMRILAEVVQKRGGAPPAWLEAAFQKEPRLKDHLENFAIRQNDGGPMFHPRGPNVHFPRGPNIHSPRGRGWRGRGFCPRGGPHQGGPDY